MEYVITVPVGFYPIDDDNAACESAYAEHLRMLMGYIEDHASNIHITAPYMSEQDYQSRKTTLDTLNINKDKIKVTAAYPSKISRTKYFFTKALPVYQQLKPIINNSILVHSGPSTNLFRPFEIFAILLAVKYKKPSIFVVDIDERKSAYMDYTTGNLSLKSYLLRKYLYDPFVDWQVKYAVKHCTLLLLKSRQMVKDYGKGLPHVKDFLDTAYSSDAIISEDKLETKVARIGREPFRLVYFGRLTKYKGILDMIMAAIAARQEIALEFTIIGDGEQKAELKAFVAQNNAENYIHFKSAVPYGPELFDILYQQDVLLATPQRQDTPRSVFDAMTNGLITVAYDTYYYRDLESSGAVVVCPWLDVKAVAKSIISLAVNPQQHANMVRAAIAFAKENTQKHWLDKRNEWLLECLKEKN